MSVELSAYGGLEPAAWLCVGTGFSKEEVKNVFLRRGVGLSSRGVLSLADLAQYLLRDSHPQGSQIPERVLSKSARQEILRRLLNEPEFRSRLPELMRLKRQRGFWKRMDRAIQSGRRAFASFEEAGVLDERLAVRYGPNPIRTEVMKLSLVWDVWISNQERDLWDEVRLLRESIEVMREGRMSARLPATITRLGVGQPEALEEQFWSELGRLTRVETLSPVDFATALGGASLPESREWSWDRWHSVEDAAEWIAEEWARSAQEDLSIWEKTAILIPDEPGVRRSLTRALERRGIPLADPRDPTELRWDERLKRALLPLQLAARGFEREAVVEWLSLRGGRSGALPTPQIKEIYQRGVRQGLDSYAGGGLLNLHDRLADLARRFGGRKRAAELRSAHLEWLRTEEGWLESDRIWAITLFTRVWDGLLEDLKCVGDQGRAVPTLHWVDRLELRLEDAAPPPAALRPQAGVRLYRLSQAPVESIERLILLALPPQWLQGQGAGDFWFTEKEREILASEFSVRSTVGVRNERASALQAWILLARKIEIADCAWEWDGKERESLRPLLVDLQAPETLEPVDRGAHPRFLPSFAPPTPLGEEPVSLPPDPALKLKEGKPEIAATALDHYSKCPFFGLVRSRWKLSDLEPPQAELPAPVKGNLLHAAVHELLTTRDEASGAFTLSCEAALSRAWEEVKPKGVLKNRRLLEIARKQLIPVLERFLEKEREYVERSQTRVKQLEGPPLGMKFQDFWVTGIPDRIDEHRDGWFIIDYKSGSDQPSGKLLLGGYRLQVPFYALALSGVWPEKPVIGVQFVELTKDGSRSKGIFFDDWVGKEEGKLVKTTARSASWLRGARPEETWSQIRESVESTGARLIAGEYTARPLRPDSDCPNCPARDVCHERRRPSIDESPVEAAE